MRLLTALAALTWLGACDVPSLEQAQGQAASIGGQALDVARGSVDTRTACMLAGQSEAFCGCVQERLGPEITDENVTAITGVVRETLEGRNVEAAANIDPATRDALVQCATHAAIQGAIGGEGESGN